MRDDDGYERWEAEYAAQVAAAQAKYDAQWPNACKTCGGTGVIVTYGVRYRSDGSGEPDTYDVCGCLEGNTCPRCGAEGAIPEAEYGAPAGPCSACGWTEDSDGRPAY